MATPDPDDWAPRQGMSIPMIGSLWRHVGGNLYTVLHIANMLDTAPYPRTVVYRDTAGAIWARPVSDWHRSMTLETVG